MLDLSEVKVQNLMTKIIGGCPVELTESSPEVVHVREIMEREGVWEEYDFAGTVYWSKDRSTVLVCF